MSFNPAVIPPENRSPASMAAHIDLYKKANDLWLVYNPTDEDFVVYHDRKRANEHVTVPNKNKDVGHGKGCQVMTSYMKDHYHQRMGEILIGKDIAEDWEKKKDKYSLEERGEREERYALRMTDPKLWDKWTPILIKGIVKRFGGDDIEQELEETQAPTQNMSPAEQSLARLGMIDMDAGVQVENAKDDFINQIT